MFLLLSFTILAFEFLLQSKLGHTRYVAAGVGDPFNAERRSCDSSFSSIVDKDSASEIRHIGFVKVHKAASSTVQNIFFRFGRKRNLTFVFTNENNYFSRESGSHYPLSIPKNRDGYDIHCVHGIFNHTLYSTILPSDTVYLAIVRDPLQVFVSAVNYYTQTNLHLPYLIKIRGNKLQNLIRKPKAYDKDFFSYTKNVMARDLGFPETFSQTVVDNYLGELDKQLKFVLIVEQFDESLILMKRYLHWSLQDILYIPNNVHVNATWSLSNLTTSDIDLFQERNRLDVLVYDFFYKRFWNQFTAEGHNIITEVLYFKSLLNKVFTFCKNDISQKLSSENVKTTLTVSETQWNPEFIVEKEDCRQMTMDELAFIKILRQEQGSELKGKLHRPIKHQGVHKEKMPPLKKFFHRH